MSNEYRAMKREVREDMHRGCDTSAVSYCKRCRGVLSVHYGQPPECDCDTPPIEMNGAFDDDGDDDV